MFDTILVSSDPNRGRTVRQVLLDTGQITVNRQLDHRLSTYELVRLLNVTQPDLLVIDLEESERLGDILCQVRERSRSTAVIGFAAEIEGAAGLAESLGVEAVLPYPMDLPTMLAAIDSAVHRTQGETIDNLFAFMPAKAGSGSSTILLNTAACLARAMGKKTLVLEADLRSGVLHILLGLEPESGIQHLLEIAGHIDAFQWENSVVRSHGMELLLTQRRAGAVIPGWHNYHLLLNFARPRYDAILVDLPELVNPATVEVVRRAASTFVTCTPEAAPIRLARQRCQEMAVWGAPPTRVRILLNRWQRGEMRGEEVAGFTGFDVAAVFPNDYRNVRDAAIHGRPVLAGSAFGRTCLDFAAQLFASSSKRVGPPGVLRRLFGV